MSVLALDAGSSYVICRTLKQRLNFRLNNQYRD